MKKVSSNNKDKSIARQNTIIKNLFDYIGAAAIAYDPTAGLAIYGLSKAWQTSLELLRQKGQEELREMVIRIANTADLESIDKNEEFAADLNNLMVDYFQESDENRRKYLRNIFINHSVSKTNNLSRFISTTRQIGEKEMLILSLFDGPIQEVLEEKIDITMKPANLTQLRMAFEKMQISMTEIEILETCNNLLVLGIFRYPNSTAGTLGGSFKNDHFIITELGLEYIEYIKE